MRNPASHCVAGEAGCQWQRLTGGQVLNKGTTVVLLPVLADGTEYTLRYHYTKEIYGSDRTPLKNMEFADASSVTSDLTLPLLNDDSVAYPNIASPVDVKSPEVAQFIELPPESADPLSAPPRYQGDKALRELYAAGRLKAVLITSPAPEGNVMLALGISYKPHTDAALNINAADQKMLPSGVAPGRLFMRRIKETDHGRISYVFPPLGQIMSTMVGTSGEGLACREKIWLASRSMNLMPPEIAGFNEVIFLVPTGGYTPEMRYGPVVAP